MRVYPKKNGERTISQVAGETSVSRSIALGACRFWRQNGRQKGERKLLISTTACNVWSEASEGMLRYLRCGNAMGEGK